jgi:transcriptional regulator with XRE-family HTH domain
MPNDDLRMAAALRALRRRDHLTQEALAVKAGTSRRTIGRIENGQAKSLTLGTLRNVFEPFDARIKTTVLWNGAALDRLLDQAHADLVEQVVQILKARGWRVELEVTYSQYGERGSLDVLGGHEESRSIVVIEVKSAVGSMEETNRQLDAKERLAPGLAAARFGWRPSTTSRLLVLPNDRSQRRIVQRHSRTIDAVYPARAREIRRWLWRPVGRISGLWFLSDGHDSSTRSGLEAPED